MDSTIIDEAYAATLKKLFDVYFNACIVAQSKTEKNAALARFTKGVVAAREARDAAKAAI